MEQFLYKKIEWYNFRSVVAGILLLLLLAACSHNNALANFVKINNKEIKVEIIDTSELIYKGLSGRDNLCEDCGMLFKFNNRQERAFVMRDMNFPIDIIWIDEDVIIGIEENLQPEGSDYKNIYESPEPVNYVLEVNAGFADKNNIKKGDKIIYNL